MSPRIPTRLLAVQPDERLLALIHDGHDRAFDALVHRYRRPLLRYCRRLRLSETRAEDVLQQAFLQAWQAIERGAEVRDARAWLYRIVHNVAVGSMRRSHGEERALDGVGVNAHALARELDLGAGIELREALADVAALPDLQRGAIVLTAVAGHSHEEAADALGVSNGAVRGLLYRARCTLRGAAAALAPPWLIARWPGSAADAGDRAVEVSAGGGAAASSGLLLKCAAIALSTGAVATGAGVIHVAREHGAPRATAGAGATLAHASSSMRTAAVGRRRPPLDAGVDRRHAARRGDDTRRRRSGSGRGEDSSSSSGEDHGGSSTSPGSGAGGPASGAPSDGGAGGSQRGGDGGSGGETAGSAGGGSPGGPGGDDGDDGVGKATVAAPVSSSSGPGSGDGGAVSGGGSGGSGGSRGADGESSEAAPAAEVTAGGDDSGDGSGGRGRS